jgi:DNA processing protein
MNNDDIYDIALSFDESLTPIEKKVLFQQYGSSERILKLEKGLLKNILGRKWTGTRFNPEDFITEAKNLKPFMEKSGISILRFDNQRYPSGLKEIPDLPFIIYYRGNIEYDYEKSISIVGTRKPGPEGLERTRSFTEYLTSKDYTIISGLAEGIDTCAHKTCVDAGGRTFAVLGCGVDRFYPVENKELGRQILDNNGCVISEYPPGIEVQRWYFPRRNRIIVGLSRGVLIAQSPERSGSLISAMLAGDYNRELFVISCGGSTDEKDKGNQMLVLSGGKEVKYPKEIVDELSYINNLSP